MSENKIGIQFKQSAAIAQADIKHFVDGVKEVNISPFIGRINFANINPEGERDAAVTIMLPIPELLTLGTQIMTLFADPGIREYLENHQSQFRKSVSEVVVTKK